MPEASADRRNRWYRVKWPDERHLKPAWADLLQANLFGADLKGADLRRI
jgi:uncharacterized protein YjbI with pentapeptide repeats